jgi:hypothetical protein
LAKPAQSALFAAKVPQGFSLIQASGPWAGRGGTAPVLLPFEVLRKPGFASCKQHLPLLDGIHAALTCEIVETRNQLPVRQIARSSKKKQDMPITNLRLEVVLATTSQGDWRGLIVDIKFSLQMLDTDFRES